MLNAFHLEGMNAFYTHQYQTAKNLFLQAIDNNPEEPDSYLFLGKSYFFCDEKSEAIVYLKKYIELNQYNLNEVANVSYAFDLLGQCYEAANQDHLAITCYTSATKINPLAASAWHNLGLLYIKSAEYYLEQDLKNSFKLFHEAHLFLKKAFEICSTNPMFLNSMASWYEKYIAALEQKETVQQQKIDNNFKLAIDYYRQALTACYADDVGLKNSITSNLTECLAQYGHYLYRAENFIKALEFYTQVIEFDSTHLAVINQIGMVFFKQNRFSEARSYFLDILTKTTESQEKADAWLNIACTYRLEKSWKNARYALKQAKMFAPFDSSIDDEEKELIASIPPKIRAETSWLKASQTLFSSSLHIASQQEFYKLYTELSTEIVGKFSERYML